MAFRAFYALPPEMVARDGTPTNAVYGFASMLNNVIAQHEPTHLAVAFDTSAPTFRSEMDKEYKAQRGETPEEFKPQVPLIIELLEAMNIAVVMQDGVEADDIIATFAEKASKKKVDTICVTGDRDYFQLVKDPCIKVMYVRRGVSDTVMYDEAGIVERTGIAPEQYVDYAAMRGDPSDNLPGIAGVGEKTAAKLLLSYGNLEGIYDNLSELSPKQREKIEEGKERVFLNREMMTLVRNVKDIPTLNQLKRSPGDAVRIAEICDRLQFRAMAKKLLTTSLVGDVHVKQSSSAIKDNVTKKITTDENRELNIDLSVDDVVGEIEKTHKPIGIHLDPHTPQAHVMDEISFPSSVLIDSGDVFGSATCTNKTQLSRIVEAIASNASNVIGYNTKLWGSTFAFFSVPQPRCIDLNVMAACDDPSRGHKTLEQACATYLGIAPGEAATQLGFDGLIDGNTHESQSASKVAYLRELHEELSNRLMNKELAALYADLEQPLTPVVSLIETTGVYVDQTKLKVISKDIHERVDKYRDEINSYAGEPINVNSTQQLRRVLFDELGLTPIKKTKTGPSTDAETLNALRDDHPIVEAILRYREVEKLRSTYIDVLGPMIASDGRIHATFNQIGSATGRMSSEAPNLQNIPIRSEEGKNLRTMFIAPQGSALCSIDYSQIELRILAHLSGEEALVEAFQRGDDVHKITASQVFKVPLDEVSYDQRSFAKVVNYGIAYGMESFGLAQRAGIDPGEAKSILDKYWSTFTSMHTYLEDVVSQATKKGYTETMFGRRRYFPELSSSIARVKQAGVRAATNAPVQGTAADVFKLAMIKTAEVIHDQKLDAKMVLTVHDELVFEVGIDSAEETAGILAKTMENVVELTVPLVADIGIGENWAEAK